MRDETTQEICGHQSDSRDHGDTLIKGFFSLQLIFSGIVMETAVTFIILISCWTVCSVPTRQSFSFSMVFGPGTRLVVHVDEEVADFDADDDLLNHQNKSAGSSNTPSIQLLSSVRLSQHPRAAPLLVCLLTGLTSPQQHILWGLDDMVLTSVRPERPWKKSKRGYSATSVREVSTADWRLTSSYWCGTTQGGKMYRQKLCVMAWPQDHFLE